jgi:hypothetical protein
MIQTGKINNTILLALYVFLSLTLTNSQLFAKGSDPAFTSLTFRLNLLTNTNRSTLHDYWKPLIGGEAEIEMPFYTGNIKAGLQLFQFNGRIDAYPDYLASYLYIGWGAEISLLSHFGWVNSIRLGSYQMRFDDTDINPTQRVESELGAGIDSGLYLSISSRWRGHIGLGYIVVFTYKKLEFLNFSVGFSYTLDAPSWLTELLK